MDADHTPLSKPRPAADTKYKPLNQPDDTDREKPSALQKIKLRQIITLTSSHKHALWLISITACLAPAALLAAFTKTLSTHLGRSGCMPNGDFVVPYSKNLWDPSLFFTPSLKFEVPYTRNSSGLTTARVTDLVWDLAVARGAQALLAWLSYRVFRRVLRAQMQAGEVAYDVFGTVTAHTGQLGTLPALCRRTFGKYPLPRTTGSRLIHVAMAIVTLYLLAIPTLFSAMTGYVSVTYPALDISSLVGGPGYSASASPADQSSATTQDCVGPLLPAFGIVQHTCFPSSHNSDAGYREDLCRPDFSNILSIPYFSPMPYDWHPWTCGGYDYRDYYERYRHRYEQCHRVGNGFAGCEALNIASSITVQCPTPVNNGFSTSIMPSEVHLEPPLLNLSIFANYDAPWKTWNGLHRYEDFSCGARLIGRSLLESESPAVQGSCQSWGPYAWGFSFYFVFIVSILNCIVAAILYGLWLYARKLAPKASDTNAFLDAALMISRAQQQFGADIYEWPAKKVNKVILTGDQGMCDSSAAYLRLRNLR